ncbi:fibronectin type III domain-containing protein [Altibacter lentus]|uniref:fibronectin type III domain-containing protein n=1 Tax=Altibacter lentus TaxID=1223410 RepID=UPI00068FBB04|nr:fibronectin type III domain-containing protein [Altibacter lentus]
MKNISLLVLLGLFVTLISCGKDDEVSGDGESPSTPLNLTATNVTDMSLQLDWEAATDNIAVTGYRVYEEISGTVVSVGPTITTYNATGLMPDTAYKYYVTAVDAAGNESAESNTIELTTALTPLEFKTNLSEMGVFTGNLSNISPATGVQLYEINSTLFTDYAAKQRLIRLPEGKMLKYDGNFLPVFPDNTLIAKTFYYNIDDRDPSLGKQLIETRIFLKISGTWEVGDYIWNASQTEAVYRETGSEIPISWIDSDGNTQNIDYLIPSKQDCFTCHNNNGTTFPIGMKLRSMNFVPSYTSMNQLDYFANNGLLEGLPSASSVTILPDWTDDATYDIFERGRAYIDVNCAHCHQPGGTVNNFNLDFRYETPFDDTAIFPNRGEIEARIQSTLPTYRMPQLGRTIVHDEAVAMLLDYLQAIED